MESQKSALRAGAAEADITPPMGVQIAGDIGRYRPVEEVREPIYARALVLELDGRRCCLLSLDLLAVTGRWAQEIRRRAAQRFGLDPSGIMVHVTQNHAAPCLGHTFIRDECGLFPPEYPWLRGGDDRYNEPTVERVVNAIAAALDSLRPVSVQIGRRTDGRVAFNRRFVMRDGSVRTHPPRCDPNILYCEGPTDPEVAVMIFRSEAGAPLAALLHHTCHPVSGYPHRFIISDWPGAWSDGVKELCGNECVPLVVNGCCGNVHHTNHLDPHYKVEHREMGRKLTETTARILEKMDALPSGILDWRVRTVRIPLRELPAAEVETARKLISEHPEPMWRDSTRTSVEWDWVYAAAMLDLYESRRQLPYYDYEVQAFRLGDSALVALTGEPFVEGQLQIKLHSPAPYTLVAHMCNGYVGYIPTRQALERLLRRAFRGYRNARRKNNDANIRVSHFLCDVAGEDADRRFGRHVGAGAERLEAASAV